MPSTFTLQPAFGSLTPDTQFVVAIACGLFVGNRHYELGERIPREEIPTFSLHALYNLRRIAVELAPAAEPAQKLVLKQEEPAAPPLPLGAALNASRQGPVRPPRR